MIPDKVKAVVAAYEALTIDEKTQAYLAIAELWKELNSADSSPNDHIPDAPC
jgi:hypothetical protein